MDTGSPESMAILQNGLAEVRGGFTEILKLLDVIKEQKDQQLAAFQDVEEPSGSQILERASKFADGNTDRGSKTEQSAGHGRKGREESGQREKHVLAQESKKDDVELHNETNHNQVNINSNNQINQQSDKTVEQGMAITENIGKQGVIKTDDNGKQVVVKAENHGRQSVVKTENHVKQGVVKTETHGKPGVFQTKNHGKPGMVKTETENHGQQEKVKTEKLGNFGDIKNKNHGKQGAIKTGNHENLKTLETEKHEKEDSITVVKQERKDTIKTDKNRSSSIHLKPVLSGEQKLRQRFRSKKTSVSCDNRLKDEYKHELAKLENGGARPKEKTRATEKSSDVETITSTIDISNESEKAVKTKSKKEETEELELRLYEDFLSKPIKAVPPRDEERITIDPEMWSEYALKETKQGRLAAEVHEKGPDTIICLDVSESMRGKPMKRARAYIQSYIEDLQNTTHREDGTTIEHVALVTFGSETTIQQHLSYEYFEVLSKLACVRPEGPSPMLAGLMMCKGAILGARMASSKYGEKFYPKVYLLSDGGVTPSSFVAGPDMCTDSQKTQEQDSVIKYCQELYKNYFMTINVVFVGENLMEFLQSITQYTKGCLITTGEWRLDTVITKTKENTNKTDTVEKDSSVVPHEQKRHALERKQYALERKQYAWERKQNASERKLQDLKNQRPEMNRPIMLEQRYSEVFPYNRYLRDEEEEIVDVASNQSDSDEENLTQSENSNFPQLGARVRRPGIRLCGTVTKCFKDGVGITWDDENPTGIVREKEDNPESIETVDQPRVLKDELIAIGCRVKRGPDWHYGNQDGESGNYGTVLEVTDMGKVEVIWDNGQRFDYRFGMDGKFELEIL